MNMGKAEQNNPICHNIKRFLHSSKQRKTS